MIKPLRRLVLGITLLAGVCLCAPGYYLVKAKIAQKLLDDAWQFSLERPEEIVKPWPWADTWPVLKLSLYQARQPTAGQGFERRAHTVAEGLLASYVVLADASGESLAFGPGLVTPGRFPGTFGNSLIAGHRDTHFAVLERVAVNDVIIIESVSGEIQRFIVDSIQIIDSRQEQPILNTGDTRLTLVTCYPFDSRIRQPVRRLLVSAKRQFAHARLASLE